jgi:Flp pilus assembly protein TadB
MVVPMNWKSDGEDGTIIDRIELIEFDGSLNKTGPLTIKMPLDLGEHSWTAVFSASEGETISHGETTHVFSMVAQPHPTSMVVWNVESPVITGREFEITVGTILPQLYVQRKQRSRLILFNGQIADALILTANSLRAGYSFLQALDIASREMPAPISQEFARALKEMNLGIPTEEALEGMTQRIDSDDWDLVVTAVLIQRQVGGNLAQVLETIAETIRERVRIKGEISTLTAQGRISGIIISLLPIGLGAVMLILNKDYLFTLFSNPVGLMMVGIAFTSQIIGGVLIKKIVNIEV